MTSTQLTCPHCGSTLNFGAALEAGAPVECLICMRSFTAGNPAAETLILEKTDKTQSPIPPAETLIVEKSELPRPTPPVGSLVTDKPEKVRTPPRVVSADEEAIPARPIVRPGRRTERATPVGGMIALVALACMLLLLIAGGVGVAFWKMSSGRSRPADPDAIAAVVPAPPAKGNEPVKVPPAKNEPADDEDLRNRKEREKKQLVRKGPAQGGDEIPWDAVANVNKEREAYVGLSQQKINLAIEKGVAHLKKTQKPNGTWANGHHVGHAAIGGLTLLECGAPADDFCVQRSATHVRGGVQKLTGTYELALAILFLDRLGDPRDRPLIQGMALRLLAGQNDCGGWTYNCPLLSPEDMYQLHAFLQSHRKPDLFNPVQRETKVAPTFQDPVAGNDPFLQLQNMIAKGERNAKTPAANVKPAPKNSVAQPFPPKKAVMPIPPQMLKANLQNLPVVKNQGKGKGQQILRAGGGDNSNTQFALLAIWAARRHDVNTDQALLSAFQRFQTSQHADGGWGYHVRGGGSTHTMTCVGLLGEAMGHGAAPEVVRFNPNNPKDTLIKPALEDPKIKDGIKKLSQHIGTPMTEGNPSSLQQQNLYFLWSVERVAMLYDLKTINGKEWYPWGAQILVHHQRPDGDWANGYYHGANPSLNTCFALLFLKRSNLVQDLTNNLRLYTGVQSVEK